MMVRPRGGGGRCGGTIRTGSAAATAVLNIARSRSGGEATVMAMLESYEPSLVAWRILSRVADAFMTVDEDDAVTEIHDVRAACQCREDAADRVVELLAALDQRQRIEIALQRQPLRQPLRRPDRIDRLVETERIHPSLARVGRQLFARAFGKADHRQVRKAPL